MWTGLEAKVNTLHQFKTSLEILLSKDTTKITLELFSTDTISSLELLTRMTPQSGIKRKKNYQKELLQKVKKKTPTTDCHNK